MESEPVQNFFSIDAPHPQAFYGILEALSPLVLSRAFSKFSAVAGKPAAFSAAPTTWRSMGDYSLIVFRISSRYEGRTFRILMETNLIIVNPLAQSTPWVKASGGGRPASGATWQRVRTTSCKSWIVRGTWLWWCWPWWQHMITIIIVIISEASRSSSGFVWKQSTKCEPSVLWTLWENETGRRKGHIKMEFRKCLEVDYRRTNTMEKTWD